MPTPVTSPAEQALRRPQSWLNIRRSAKDMTPSPSDPAKQANSRLGVIIAIIIIAIIGLIFAAHSTVSPSDVEIAHIDQLVLARAKAKYPDCYIIREISHYKIRKIGDSKNGIFYYRIKAYGQTITATAYWTISDGTISIDKIVY